jgi:hypothetical protein
MAYPAFYHILKYLLYLKQARLSNNSIPRTPELARSQAIDPIPSVGGWSRFRSWHNSSKRVLYSQLNQGLKDDSTHAFW